ncbi:phospholipid carrier-dependent glycosyltransferase [Actinomadura viridis]|uniref:phospholipid carrier-dependent glycosyltransferase n=1 Tax=Actinomadura viridis TaxID=58110 RepID=UPI0036B6AC43
MTDNVTDDTPRPAPAARGPLTTPGRKWAIRPNPRARSALSRAPFLLAFIGAVAVRWTTVLGHPGVLWFTGDSYFYLGHALDPGPSASKSLGYSFLLALLEPAHSLRLVAVLQHLMGLAVAVMVYALLRRAGLPGWASTLFTLPVLYDAYQIELEHLLMSEAFFTFLIAAALTLLLWRTPPPDGAGAKGGRGPAWWMALAAGLLLGYAVLVRSAGAPLVPVVLLCLLARRGGWRPALIFGAAAAAPLVAYAAWFHGTYGTYALTTSDGLFLWGRTAPFADCAKMRPPSHQRALCLSDELRAEGRAPGNLIWRSEAPPRILYEDVTDPGNNKILRDFAVRAILAQPGDYLRAVGEGLGMAFSPRRFPHPTPSTEALYHFPGRPHVFPGGRSWGAEGSTALSDAMRYERSTILSRVVRPHADRMIAYQRAVHLPGPALALIFAAGAAGAPVARDRHGVAMAWTCAATLLVFPIASADFDYRYVVPAMPFACLAAGLALTRAFPRARPAREGEDGPGDEAAGGNGDGDRDRDGGRDRDGAGEGRVSRRWGSRGSRRRGSDPASAP